MNWLECARDIECQGIALPRMNKSVILLVFVLRAALSDRGWLFYCVVPTVAPELIN